MMNEINSVEINPHNNSFANKISIHPLTENCENIYQKKEHICLGISPFNSLFSEEYLTAIIRFALQNFKSFHIFLPDEPTIFTLEALGYSKDESRKKMRKQINWLRNKILKALSANNLEDGDRFILDWAVLSRNEVYLDELKKVRSAFETDANFKAVCMDGSRWVLQNKLPENELTESKFLTAANYLLAEFPLFARTNEILGIETSLFCYHQSIDLLECLYRQQLIYRPSYYQGFGILTCMN
jgi:cyclo(L-tyrosyl-L-tyrosyl) synthase